MTRFEAIRVLLLVTAFDLLSQFEAKITRRERRRGGRQNTKTPRRIKLGRVASGW
jgi:hypothetical protein